MSVPEYTTVVGIDAKHFEQLCTVWLTWKTHKPSLLQHPMIVFVDRFNPVDEDLIRTNIDHPDLRIVQWPPDGVEYPEETLDSKNKFGKAQRYKMMAGFVHVPAMYVQTPYWLKLDADAIAMGQDDWIDPTWFAGSPNIVAHKWGFTKPANLIQRLDDWATRTGQDASFGNGPLNIPLDSPESERISHSRICSWCGFFNTRITRYASRVAEIHCGEGMLPVPSQDTYMWYFCTRIDPTSVLRVSMKNQGWTYRSSFKSVRAVVNTSLGIGEDRGL